MLHNNADLENLSQFITIHLGKSESYGFDTNIGRLQLFLYGTAFLISVATVDVSGVVDVDSHLNDSENYVF